MPDLEVIEKHLQIFISDLENLKKHSGVTIGEIKRKDGTRIYADEIRLGNRS